MNENETLVTEVAENAEQTAEQTQQEAKIYTQEEVNAIVGKARARAKANAERNAERKYSRLTDALKAGTGKEGVDEQADFVEKFYEGRGIKIQKPQYSAKDIETLARAEANEIIGAGYEDVVDEVDRLAEIGIEKMTQRERAYFKVLAEHRQNAERAQELAKIGVSEDVLNSPEFKEFQGMFKENTPISKVYEQYQKTQPKKEFKIPGSMKSQTAEPAVKDFYSYEEASKFTKADFDKMGYQGRLKLKQEQPEVYAQMTGKSTN